MKENKPKNDETIRLQVYLSHSGVCSRREAATMIEEGRVEVNNETITEPGFRVGKSDTIKFDGEEIRQTKNHAYILLHKPEGFVCSNSDPEGRPTAVSLVQSHFSQRLFTVGRLDILSTGLVLITSDGEFADKIMHPRHAIEKEYLVETQKEIPLDMLKAWVKGIPVKGVTYRLKSYQEMSARKVRLVLTEGKNREIRNVFAHFRVTIRKLHRIRIGTFWLSEIPKGGFVKITQEEAMTLTKAPVKKGKKTTKPITVRKRK